MIRVILFDGECNFCNKSVQFILNNDSKEYFKLASLQSNIGKKIIQEYNIKQNTDSIVYIENNKYYSKSSAVLRICKKLDGIIKIGFVLLIVPKPIRDFFYRIFANNRYKWFGKNNCIIPTSEIKKRFLI
ncbi:DCC1-like thiol-disulfide oxidoreductase family protein [Mammaliicoccus lentus]|uniref:DCC1-like thiol-disulfide oxidoreductase family protein n=1 Tax=Mammaliicoccus lentus TaxID=42858 RepID=A0AAX3W472_MAMLE|nr:DCC1-like thiol-disulfide oxidoreductase family protein [Mammaliicoccus lentus]WHI59706.1 DCC1-like thiol-disulfide oxidoreductase family protein [Mammaliicoccus lentus]